MIIKTFIFVCFPNDDDRTVLQSDQVDLMTTVDTTQTANFGGEISGFVVTSSSATFTTDIAIDMYADPNGQSLPLNTNEYDPEILKAQMDLLSSPYSAAYADEAYLAVANVQQQCQADYVSTCTATGNFIVALNDFFGEFASPDDFIQSRRRKLIDNVRPPSFFHDRVVDPLRHMYHAVTRTKAPHMEGEEMRPDQLSQGQDQMKGRPAPEMAGDRPMERPMERPDGPRDRPDGPRDRPDGPRDRPDGPRDRPDGPRDRPDGPRDRPDGPRDRPDGPRDRPDGPRDRPDGPRPQGDGPPINRAQLLALRGGMGAPHHGAHLGPDGSGRPVRSAELGANGHGQWEGHNDWKESANSAENSASSSASVASVAAVAPLETPPVTLMEAPAMAAVDVPAAATIARRALWAGDHNSHGGDHHGWHDWHGGNSNSNSGNSGDSSSSSSSGGYYRHHDHHPRGPRREPFVSYQGALGFGMDGDSCVYANLDTFSQPCQQAVQDLYAFRYDYQDQGRKCHGFFWIIFGVFVLMYVLGRKHRARRQKIVALLKALEANPALKTMVEAETGLVVPPPPCCEKRCGCLVRAISTFVCVVLTGFCLVMTSLIVSGHVIMAMSSVDESTGVVTYPTPGTIILIVALVIFANLLLLVSVASLACSVVKKLKARRQARSAAGSDGDNNVLSPNNRWRRPRYFVARLVNMMPTIPAWASFRSPSPSMGSPSRGLYAPLNMEEQTEMVNFEYGASGSQSPQYVLPQQVYAPQVYIPPMATSAPPVYVPATLSAESMSHVNML
jgi:hypothetical protein